MRLTRDGLGNWVAGEGGLSVTICAGGVQRSIANAGGARIMDDCDWCVYQREGRLFARGIRPEVLASGEMPLGPNAGANDVVAAFGRWGAFLDQPPAGVTRYRTDRGPCDKLPLAFGPAGEMAVKATDSGGLDVYIENGHFAYTASSPFAAVSDVHFDKYGNLSWVQNSKAFTSTAPLFTLPNCGLIGWLRTFWHQDVRYCLYRAYGGPAPLLLHDQSGFGWVLAQGWELSFGPDAAGLANGQIRAVWSHGQGEQPGDFVIRDLDVATKTDLTHLFDAAEPPPIEVPPPQPPTPQPKPPVPPIPVPPLPTPIPQPVPNGDDMPAILLTGEELTQHYEHCLEETRIVLLAKHGIVVDGADAIRRIQEADDCIHAACEKLKHPLRTVTPDENLRLQELFFLPTRDADGNRDRMFQYALRSERLRRN